MDALRALKVQTKIIKLIGKGAVDMINNKKPINEKINDLIPMVAQNFDDELANDIVQECFKKDVFIRKDGNLSVIDFASHFRGNPWGMWKVLGFIMEANFSMGES
jgi:hypothetical protein